MDVKTALELILRDLNSLGFDVVGMALGAAFLGLPIVSLVLALRGRRLPALAFVLSAGIWTLWFLYYAIDLFPNPGLIGVHVAMYATAFGWALVVLSLIAPWRRGPFPELLDIRALLHPSPEQIVDLRGLKRRER